MPGQIEAQTFIVAAVAVFIGALARRAAELEKMEVIEPHLLFRMLWIELMLIPAFAACVGFAVIYFEMVWVFVVPIGVAAGLGGFATGHLIFELLRTVLTTMAERVGGAR